MFPANPHLFNRFETYDGKQVHSAIWGDDGEGYLTPYCDTDLWLLREPLLGFKVGRWIRSFGEYLGHKTALAPMYINTDLPGLNEPIAPIITPWIRLAEGVDDPDPVKMIHWAMLIKKKD